MSSSSTSASDLTALIILFLLLLLLFWTLLVHSISFSLRFILFTSIVRSTVHQHPSHKISLLQFLSAALYISPTILPDSVAVFRLIFFYHKPSLSLCFVQQLYVATLLSTFSIEHFPILRRCKILMQKYTKLNLLSPKLFKQTNCSKTY